MNAISLRHARRHGPAVSFRTVHAAVNCVRLQLVFGLLTHSIVTVGRLYLRRVAGVKTRSRRKERPVPRLPVALHERLAREALDAEDRSAAAALRLGLVSKIWRAALKGTPLALQSPLEELS